MFLVFGFYILIQYKNFNSVDNCVDKNKCNVFLSVYFYKNVEFIFEKMLKYVILMYIMYYYNICLKI